MKYLIILLLTITQVYAIDVTPIKKGESAPAQGFFVDTENMKELRQINEKKKLLEKENITLKDLNVLQEGRTEVYKKLSNEMEKQLRWEKTKSNFKGIGGFVLGVLATSLATYAAIKVSK